MTVKWSKVSGAKGYELQYTRDKNFKSGITKKTLKPSVGNQSVIHSVFVKSYTCVILTLEKGA